MKNAKLLLGVGLGIGAIVLLSGNANAAVAGGPRGNCAPPNIWVNVGPGSTPGAVALAQKYGDGSGYCAKQGTVSDAGTQPAGFFAAVSSSFNDAYAKLVGFLGNTASSSTGPVTDPSQVADAGPANSPQFDPLGDA